jgi:hypothetical protein
MCLRQRSPSYGNDQERKGISMTSSKRHQVVPAKDNGWQCGMATRPAADVVTAGGGRAQPAKPSLALTGGRGLLHPMYWGPMSGNEKM